MKKVSVSVLCALVMLTGQVEYVSFRGCNQQGYSILTVYQTWVITHSNLVLHD